MAIISFTVSIVLSSLFRYFPLSVIVIATLLALIVIVRKKSVVQIFLAGLLAVAVFQLQGYRHGETVIDEPIEDVKVEGVFESIPQPSRFGFLQDFIIERSSVILPKRITLFLNYEIPPGTGALLSVRINPNDRRRNPGGYLSDDRLTGTVRETYSMYAVSSLRWQMQRARYRLVKYFMSNFDPDSAGLLSAITVGYMGGVTDGVRNSFRNTGLTHILSISGSHFALMSFVIFGLIVSSIHLLPLRLLNRLTVFILPKQLAAVITIPLIFVYLKLSGESTPAVRSFIIINMFLLGLLIGRRGAWLNNIFIAAAIILSMDYQGLYTISFQLSFLSVLFIGLAVDEMKRDETGDARGQGLRKKVYKYLFEGLTISLAAFIGTLPFVMYYFHYIPILSPVTNLIVAPLLCYLVLPYAFFGSVIYLFTGYFPFVAQFSLVCQWTLKAVSVFAAVPHTAPFIRSFPILLALSLTAGFVLFLNRRRRIFSYPIIIISIAMIFYCWRFSKDAGMSVTFLDVGTGDGAVVETDDGITIAIDTGKSGREVENFLHYRGHDRIDALFLSHPENDHMGGLGLLLKDFDVRRVYDNGAGEYSLEIKEYFKRDNIVNTALNAGDVIRCGYVSIGVYNPGRWLEAVTSLKDLSNNSSLIFKLKGRYRSFLFTGDAEEMAEETVARLGSEIRSDVLKVGHHGSATSSSEEFIETVSPVFSVISVKRHNSYGHPSREVVSRLSKTYLYRTDRDGAVGFVETAKGFIVKRYADYEFQKVSSPREELTNIRRLLSVW